MKQLAKKTGIDNKVITALFKKFVDLGLAQVKKGIATPTDKFKHIINKQAIDRKIAIDEKVKALSENPAFDWLMGQRTVKMVKKTTVGKAGVGDISGKYGAAKTEHTPNGLKDDPEIRHIVSYADYTLQVSFAKEVGRVIANEIDTEVNDYKDEYKALGYMKAVNKTVLSDALLGVGMLTHIPAYLIGKVTNTERDIKNNPFFAAGSYLSDLWKDRDDMKQSFGYQLVQGFGSLTGFMIGASLTGGISSLGNLTKTGALNIAKLSRVLAEDLIPTGSKLSAYSKMLSEAVKSPSFTTMMQGSLVQAGSEFKEAYDKTNDFSKALAVGLANLGYGATEVIPIDRFFERLLIGNSKASIGEMLKKAFSPKMAFAQGGEESVQEFMQQLGSNWTASQLYDASRPLFEGVFEGGAIGFITGFFLPVLGGAVKLAANRKGVTEEDIRKANLLLNELKELENRLTPQVQEAENVINNKISETQQKQFDASKLKDEVTETEPTAEEILKALQQSGNVKVSKSKDKKGKTSTQSETPNVIVEPLKPEAEVKVEPVKTEPVTPEPVKTETVKPENKQQTAKVPMMLTEKTKNILRKLGYPDEVIRNEIRPEDAKEIIKKAVNFSDYENFKQEKAGIDAQAETLLKMILGDDYKPAEEIQTESKPETKLRDEASKALIRDKADDIIRSLKKEKGSFALSEKDKEQSIDWLKRENIYSSLTDEQKAYVDSIDKTLKPEVEPESVDDSIETILKRNMDNGLGKEAVKGDNKRISDHFLNKSPEVLKDYPELAKTQEENQRLLERKNRILTEGTGFDKEFGLIPVKDIKSTADISANIDKILQTLKENEGNGKYDTFEGFAYKGNFTKNAGEQVREYMLGIDVIPKELQQQFFNEIGVSTNQDLKKWGEKRYKEIKSKNIVTPEADTKKVQQATTSKALEIEQAKNELIGFVNKQKLPKEILEKIGGEEKPLLLKENVYDKNRKEHPELTDKEDREILDDTINKSTAIINDKAVTKPNYWVFIKQNGKDKLAVIEINENKDNYEIVNWRYGNKGDILRIIKRAIREGGQVLINNPKEFEKISADLSDVPNNLIKDKKGENNNQEKKLEEQTDKLIKETTPDTLTKSDIKKTEEAVDNLIDKSKPSKTDVSLKEQKKNVLEQLDKAMRTLLTDEEMNTIKEMKKTMNNGTWFENMMKDKHGSVENAGNKLREAGFKVNKEGKRIQFDILGDGKFSIYIETLDTFYDKIKKEYPENTKVPQRSTSRYTGRKLTPYETAERLPNFQRAEDELQAAKENLAEAESNLKAGTGTKQLVDLMKANLDEAQKIYDYAKEYDYEKRDKNIAEEKARIEQDEKNTKEFEEYTKATKGKGYNNIGSYLLAKELNLLSDKKTIYSHKELKFVQYIKNHYDGDIDNFIKEVREKHPDYFKKDGEPSSRINNNNKPFVIKQYKDHLVEGDYSKSKWTYSEDGERVSHYKKMLEISNKPVQQETTSQTKEYSDIVTGQKNASEVNIGDFVRPLNRKETKAGNANLDDGLYEVIKINDKSLRLKNVNDGKEFTVQKAQWNNADKEISFDVLDKDEVKKAIEKKQGETPALEEGEEIKRGEETVAENTTIEEAKPEPEITETKLPEKIDGKEVISLEELKDLEKKAEEIEDIEDTGEKVGMARKDTAKKGSAKANKDERAGWEKKYEIYRIKDNGEMILGKDNDKSVGTFTLGVKRSDGRVITIKKGIETYEEAQSLIPIVEASRMFRVYKDSESDTYTIYRKFGERKLTAIKRGFESERAASEYLVRNARDLVNMKMPVLQRPILDKIVRQGKQRRTGHVKPEDFAKTFGFRGVEFGNWVKNTERQEALDTAYDGLMDLADVLGIPYNAISLDGRLALAFGARGHGFRTGAAHYEPQRIVINLTKLKGDGSLSHEWGHAFDYYFGMFGYPLAETMTGGVVKPKNANPFTELVNQPRVRGELKAALERAVNTILNKMVDKEIDVTEREELLKRRLEDTKKYELDNTRGWLKEKGWKKTHKTATEEQLKKWDELVDRIMNLDLGKETVRPENKKSRWSLPTASYEVLDELSDLYKELRGRTGFAEKDIFYNLSYKLRNLMNQKRELDKLRENNIVKTSVRTDFVREAIKLDSFRASPCYATRVELFARAFEAYVLDKLSEQGLRSDYLVYGADNKFYGINFLTGIKENPYPEGEERTAMNEAFDAVFKELKSEQKDREVLPESAYTDKNSYESALKRASERVGELYSNPFVVFGAARDSFIIGKHWFMKGLTAFKEWSKKMLELLGDKIKPILDKIWVKVSKKGDITNGDIKDITDEMYSPYYDKLKDLIDTKAEFKPTEIKQSIGKNVDNMLQELNNAGFIEKQENGTYKFKGTIDDIVNAVIDNPEDFKDTYTELFPQAKYMVNGWHGSPYDFNKFLSEKIGTGEGAQAFGHGLYISDLEGIARHYANKLTDITAWFEDIKVKGKTLKELHATWQGIYDAFKILRVADKEQSNLWGINKAIEEEIKFFKKTFSDGTADYWQSESKLKILKTLRNLTPEDIEIPKRSHLYRVTIYKGKTPEQYDWLDWDKEPTQKVLDKVNAALKAQFPGDNFGFDKEDKNTGEDIYKFITEQFLNDPVNTGVRNVKDAQREASSLLLGYGIDGIRYPAESLSRGATRETAKGFNYVVFDENAITIEEHIKYLQEKAAKEIFGTREYTPKDLEQVEDIHRKLFGKQAITPQTLQIVKNALQNAGWLGKNMGNLIQLADLTLKSDPTLPMWHEGFHKSFSILLTRTEQEKILDYYIDKVPELQTAWNEAGNDFNAKQRVYIEAEEHMNDEFQQYRKDRSGFMGTVRLIFDKLMRRLKILLKNFPVIQEFAKKMGMEFDYAKLDAEKLFRDIMSGKAGKVLEEIGANRAKDEGIGYREEPAYMKGGEPITNEYIRELRGKIKNQKPVILEKNKMPYLDKISKIIDWYTKNVRQTAHQKDIKGEILADGRAVKNTLSHGYGKAKVETLQVLPELVDNGILAFEQGEGNNKNYFIVSPLKMEGESYHTFILVKSDNNGKRLYVHEVLETKKLREVQPVPLSFLITAFWLPEVFNKT